MSNSFVVVLCLVFVVGSKWRLVSCCDSSSIAAVVTAFYPSSTDSMNETEKRWMSYFMDMMFPMIAIYGTSDSIAFLQKMWPQLESRRYIVREAEDLLFFKFQKSLKPDANCSLSLLEILEVEKPLSVSDTIIRGLFNTSYYAYIDILAFREKSSWSQINNGNAFPILEGKLGVHTAQLKRY
jgi:hypothetical protein